MASRWRATVSWLRFHRFEDAALEATFQQKHRPLAAQSCRLWAAIQLFYLTAFLVCTGCVDPLVLDAASWALFGVPLVLGAALVALSRTGRLAGDRLGAALAAGYCVTLVIHGIQYWLFLRYHHQRGWGLPAPDPPAVQALDRTWSFLLLVISAADQHLQLLPLLDIGFCPASGIAIACGPLAGVLLPALAMPQYPALLLAPAVCSAFHATIAGAHCRNGSALRRSLFMMQLQKAQHSEQTRRADAAVNHVLKNAMAEAGGLVEVYLEAVTPPDPAAGYLHGALERLHGGMAWCRRRGALLALLADEARPAPRPTSLPRLGDALVAARAITASFAPVAVHLDHDLADLMLEIVLSNAFRHGHPTSPNVQFSIAVDVPDPRADECTVTFRVTNRSDPACQLCPQLVRRLMHAGSPRPSPTETTAECQSSGLVHCFRAALVQGMAVSLVQEDGVVTFEASVATRLVREAPPHLPARYDEEGKFPPGLRVAVIDDSATARMLLKHQLSREPFCCVVDTFGESAADVESFLCHALRAADIAILDQHLDWPCSDLLYGTDLVRLLLHSGFQGLLCIRSANTSEADVGQYYAAGAHCVLDKLLDRAQAAATLAGHYRLLRAARPTGGTPDPFPPLSDAPPDADRSVPFGVVPGPGCV
eukprot:EG_transcript_3753